MSTDLRRVQLDSFYEGNITFNGRLLAVYERTTVLGRLEMLVCGTRECLVRKRIEVYQTKDGQFIEYKPSYIGCSRGSWRFIKRQKYLRLLRKYDTKQESPEFIR